MKKSGQITGKTLALKLAVCIASLLCLFIFLSLSGCGGDKEYRVEIEGEIEAPGVITYLGHVMNVYKDQASNPCGDCVDQPVSVFVGDSAETVAAAIKKALVEDFAFGDWEVVSLDGTTLTVAPAQGVRPGKPEPPAAPAGLSIRGGFDGELTGGRSGGGTAAGGAGGQVRNIKQFDGAMTAVPLIPERIAAVYGPSYEALVLLGAEDRIVARADVQTTNFPWASEIFGRIDGLPVLADVHAAVNVEQLLTYQPDLVYTFPRPGETAILDKAQVSYVTGATTTTLADVKALLYVFASGIGAEARERAKLYEQWFDARLVFIRERTAGLTTEQRPRVYYAGTEVLVTYGRDADIIAVIEAAGGAAVSKDLPGGNRVQIDADKLVSWDPDWIFIDNCGMSGSEDGSADEVMARAYTNSRYAGISAVKEGRIIPVPSGVFYWDMGVQKILLVEYMAKTLHPELFADLDMAGEIADFYQTFFDYPLTYEQAVMILERRDPGGHS